MLAPSWSRFNVEQSKCYTVEPVCDISRDKSLQGNDVADNHYEDIASERSNQRSPAHVRFANGEAFIVSALGRLRIGPSQVRLDVVSFGLD
ncbi:hypothetical protein F2Q69_00059367 [Brassica cretica]|uniref:Uncharacterized protein n=1 Tax=Brassica cretica TaxID=69181 RepID=A0A8S9RMI5_BRACR|nr:hypothetical protein F2Q69_00059367 [Brassica cretica]